MGGASNMIATIVGAVADCGAITTESAQCAAAVTGLTGAAAGLAAASAGIVDACPNSLKIPNGLPDNGTAQETNLGICIIDAKGALSSLFSASKYLSQAADCKQNGDFPTRPSTSSVPLPIWARTWPQALVIAPASREME